VTTSSLSISSLDSGTN